MNNGRITRATATRAWKADWTNFEKLQTLLSLPLQFQVAEEARMIPCLCAPCVLSEQDDFKQQKSGLMEIYEKHNQTKNKQHFCTFLPKFHPELNPIERVWSRMKWYVRKHSSGGLQNLAEHMDIGLSLANLSLCNIRRYVRLVSYYYAAYLEGMDIVQAEDWMRKHRQHRSYADLMDSKLEQIYFPKGRENALESEVLCGESLEELAELLVDFSLTGRV